MENIRVALVHDWLTGQRGGEKVLEVLAEIFPDAPIYTLFHFPGSQAPGIEGRTIRTSFLQRLPGLRKRYRLYLPLFPLAAELFDLRDFDLVVSSSHCVAKGVITRPDAVHVSYVHTPVRYAWGQYQDYFGPGKLSYYSHARLRVLSVSEEQAHPRLFRFLRFLSPRLERGVKKHFLNMILGLSFELEVEKPTPTP